MIAIGKIGTQWSGDWRTRKYTVREKEIGRIGLNPFLQSATKEWAWHIISVYARRWQIELTFRYGKTNWAWKVRALKKEKSVKSCC